MKHHISGPAMAGLLLFCAGYLKAADDLKVDWNQVCRAAAGNELSISTAAGDTVEGYCFSVGVDEISIRTREHGLVKVARSSLAKIQMHRPNKGHQLASLRRQLHHSLSKELDLLLSPHAVAGIVSIPPTLAYGAVAVPFCILGDLKDKLTPNRELQIN